MLRGDNALVITWVNKWGATRDPRATFLLRLIGVVEMSTGWCF